MLLPNEQQAKIHADRGNRLLQENRYADAQSEFIAAVREDPRNGPALMYLAEIQSMGGHLQQALTFASRAVREQSDNVRAWTLLANIYCQLGGVYMVLALDQIEMGLSIDPTSANLYYLKGNCHAQLGEKHLAKAAYDKALEINPKHPFALYDSQALALAAQAEEQATGS
jgi:Flp pilus assembly protein TadD